jgi:uncharacterized protein YbjQ (UPF0145 family)
MPALRPTPRLARFASTVVIGLVLVLSGTVGLVATAAEEGLDPDEEVAIEVFLNDRDELDRLIGLGVDLDHQIGEAKDGRLVAQAILSVAEAEELRTAGFETGRVLWRASESMQILEQRDAERAAEQAQAAAALAELQAQAATLATDAVVIMRADWYTTGDTGQVIYIEARTSAGDDPGVNLQMCWDAGPGTPIDAGGCEDMNRFEDADQYMFHRDSNSWTGTPPSMVRVTSELGGVATAATAEWLPSQGEPPRNDPYDSDFITDYMNPTELYAAYDALAAEFPGLVQVIDLPRATNGYRRKAQANLWGGNPGGSVTGGAANTSRTVVVTSKAWGHEGGNDLTIALANPGVGDSPLSVAVAGNAIMVNLATDAGGALTSTAAAVVAAVNADTAASALIYAHLYRGNAGAGIVQAQAVTPLSDYLVAPPEISREPFPVRAYKIGNPSNSAKIGVLAYAQEHAREWVPPLVALETATRLVRNYGNDGATKQLLNKIDVYFIPSVNPDGGHYSFFNFSSQRRNMTNHCADNNADPGRRNAWGVDNNRNYDYGSIFDGYSGASSSCTSDVFSGPAELSEPESYNVTWLVDHNPNIKFSMNLHSSGNYFMWSPGSYTLPDRITLPRPTVGQEAFFWGASNRILTEIKRHRNLAVTPERTGPIADVLYSAAGNSGDRLWYVNHLFAWNFEVGTSFQPGWDEAHDEVMEFSNGLMELVRVAYDFGKDKQRPKTQVQVAPGSTAGTVDVTFTRTEPVSIFYTLDGSRPTFASPQIQSAGIRQLDETLTLSAATTIKWFSLDQAGNIENGYDPSGSAENYNRAEVSITN